MNKGANLAIFSDEFGKNYVEKAMNGRGSDESEGPAKLARHKDRTFENIPTSDEIVHSEARGARYTTTAETSPNEAGK